MIQWLRSLLFVGQMYLMMALMAVYFTPWAIVDKRGAYAGVRTYCRWVRWTARWMVGLSTEIRGTVPTDEVLIASKHQSFLDIIMIVSVVPRPKFIMKQQLKWAPILGWYALRIGCVPVDRASSNDVVAQMRDAFAETDDMILAIPPEGTRGEVTAWKSGFYHIAHTADVPIIMSVLDYGARRISLAATLIPSGDYEADLPRIQSCYADATGKHAGKFKV